MATVGWRLAPIFTDSLASFSMECGECKVLATNSQAKEKSRSVSGYFGGV